MGLGEAVTQTRSAGGLVVGLGFRKQASVDTLVALVEAALAAAGGTADRGFRLATIAEKDRPVLHAAARRLGCEFDILPKEALAAVMGDVTILSERARACVGVASVAEAAALAAAGPGGRLVVPRMTGPDATCAVALGAQPSREASGG